MFSTEAKRKWGFVCGTVLVLFISFHVIRTVAYSAQRNCLRAIVKDLSTVLDNHKLDYWWDFGTLLGLVREHDIIYSEFDADISIPMQTRSVFYSEPGLVDDLDALGYTISERDEYKLRLFGPWGWFGDMDVWTTGTNVSTLFMVTGKNIERSRYVLPQSLLLPTQPISAVGISLSHRSGIPDSVRVPAKPQEVLRYWYGKTWNIPLKYEKGNDPSTDMLEMFLVHNLMWVFELFSSFKALVRILINGTANFFFLRWNSANVLGFFTASVLTWGLLRDQQRRTPLFIVVVSLLSAFTCAFVMATVLAVG